MLLAGLLGVLAVGLLGLPLTHGKNLYTQELHDDTTMEERMDAINDIHNNPSAFVETGSSSGAHLQVSLAAIQHHHRHPTSSSWSEARAATRPP